MSHSPISIGSSLCIWMAFPAAVIVCLNACADAPHLLSRIGQYPYANWFAWRVTIFLCAGAWRCPLSVVGTAIAMTLPFTIAAAYLEAVTCNRLVLCEVLLWLWGGEVAYLRRQADRIQDNAYRAALFVAAFTPLFFVCLLREIWQYETAWLYWLTPYGLSFMSQTPWYCLLCLFSPPIAWKLAMWMSGAVVNAGSRCDVRSG